MMMGFRSGLSLRPSLTRDILRFPTVQVPFRLPSLGFFVVVAMESFVLVVASCPLLGCIAFVDLVFHRRLLGVLVVHTLGIAVLACVFGILLVIGSVLVVV